MADFCIYCGKLLQNGVCTCAEFQTAQQQQMAAQQQILAQQMAAQQQILAQQMAAQQMGQGMPQGQPFGANMYAGGVAQNTYTQGAKDQLSKSKSLFVDFIKHPISMMGKMYTGEDKKTAVLMGVFHLLIFVLICLTKIPLLELGDKVGIGLKIAIAVGTFVMVHVLIAFGAAKYRHVSVNFMSVVGIFCVATIPSSAFLILAWLMSYISWTVCILCMMVALLSWIVLLTEAVGVTLQTNRDIAYWVSLGIMVLVVIISVFIIKKIAVGIATQLAVGALKGGADSLLGGLGSLGDLLGNMY
ncbi:MAG: hypothetical protein SOY45_07165 [Lachnospiraceae bacterium]|nr:hypothetical protein [Lachnospiraceae bacterium]